MLNAKNFILAGGLLTALSLGAAQQANADLLYTYTGDAPGAVGGQTTAGTVLNDGLYSADQANIASVVAWDGTDGVGAIWNVNPTLTLDLGSVQSFDSILIDYQTWDGAGVTDWTSVDVSIDAGAATTFTNFPAAGTGGEGTIRQVTLDLAGSSGQTIELSFTRADDWGPISEIDVNVIPEPASLALLGLGGLMLIKRRNRDK